MSHPKPYLKVAAVVSAVLLVGAFVSYRAGVFQRPAPAEPPTPDVTPVAAEPQTPSDADQQQAFMYGSKSAPAFGPPSPAPPPEKPPEFMAGSKSFRIISLPPAGTPPALSAPKP